MTAKSSISRDTLAYWSAQIGVMALNLVTSIFIARRLGAEGKGLVNGVLLAGFMSVNLSNLGVQVIGMYFTGKRPGEIGRTHTLIVILVALIAAFDLIVIALFGERLRALAFEEISWRYLWFAPGALPFMLYYMAAQGVMTGLRRVRELAWFLFMVALVTNLANWAVLAFATSKAAWLIGIWAASQALAAGALAYKIIAQPCGWVRMTLLEIRAGLAELLSYGLRAFAGNFAANFLQKNDQLFISSTGGVVGLGIYSLSSTLSGLAMQPSAALENAGYAQVAGAGRDEAARLARELFRTNFMINGSLALVIVAIAHPLIKYVFGEEFIGGVAPLRILVLGTLAISCARMLALYFSAQLGRPQIPSAIAWVGFVINVPAMWWVVVHSGRGMIGAACVTAGCYGLILVIYLVLFAYQTGLTNPLEFFIPQRRDFARIARLIGDFKSRE